MIREGRQSAANALIQPLAYEVERLRLYAEIHLNARFALPTFMLIVSLVVSQWLGIMIALYWGVTTMLGYGVLLSVCNRLTKSGNQELNLP